MYNLLALDTVLAAMMLFWVTFNVGRARAKFGIMPPAISGNENFERYFRVHQNTIEWAVIFLPLLWVAGIYVSEFFAASVGGVWIIGRVIYAIGYYKSTKGRMPGFIINLLTVAVLGLCALYGVVTKLIGL